LAESGSLFTVDLDFKYTAIVKLTTPDVTSPDLPSKEYSVVHMAAGWRFSAAVIKGIGLIVWEPTVPNHRETMVRLANNMITKTPLERNWRARRILRTEEVDTNTLSANSEIIGLMVGDGYLVYLTELGTVHRVNITDDILTSSSQPSSFLLEKFSISPKLSYLSGSFFHFGLFNTTGDVLVGNVQTGPDTPPSIEEGLQHRGVIALSWGDWHGLALCEDGSVLSWGRELWKNGCLGMGYQSLDEAREMGLQVVDNGIVSDIPRKVPGFGGEENNFAFCVAAAGWHSAALVADFKAQEVRKRDW
jgi:SCF-associated factor 1